MNFFYLTVITIGVALAAPSADEIQNSLVENEFSQSLMNLQNGNRPSFEEMFKPIIDRIMDMNQNFDKEKLMGLIKDKLQNQPELMKLIQEELKIIQELLNKEKLAYQDAVNAIQELLKDKLPADEFNKLIEEANKMMPSREAIMKAIDDKIKQAEEYLNNLKQAIKDKLTGKPPSVAI